MNRNQLIILFALILVIIPIFLAQTTIKTTTTTNSTSSTIKTTSTSTSSITTTKTTTTSMSTTAPTTIPKSNATINTIIANVITVYGKNSLFNDSRNFTFIKQIIFNPNSLNQTTENIIIYNSGAVLIPISQLSNLTSLPPAKVNGIYNNFKPYLGTNITKTILVKNASINLTYGIVKQSGSFVKSNVLLNYSVYNTHVLTFETVNVIQRPSPIRIDMQGVSFTQPTGVEHIIRPPILPGQTTYTLTGSFSGVQLPGNPTTYTLNVILSNGLVLQSSQFTANSLNDPFSVTLPANINATLSLCSSGNENYTSTCIDPVSAPANIIAYIPINIVNSRNTGTPDPFQQSVSINMLNYPQYVVSNVVNAEFFYANGLLINSWLEGNVQAETSNANLNTNTLLYWVSINGLSANGITGDSQTIYYGWAGNVITSSNDLFDCQVTGENPNLFNVGGYGSCDNGNVIFPVYQNFQGSSAFGPWTNNGETWNNGVTSSTTAIANVVFQGKIIPSNTVDMLIKTQINKNANADFVGFVSNALPPYRAVGYLLAGDTQAEDYIQSVDTHTVGSLIVPSFTTNVLTAYWSNTAGGAFQIGYGALDSVIQTTNSILTVGMAQDGSIPSANVPTMYYIRVRATPPSLTMPLTILGNVIISPSSLIIGSNPITYGSTTTVKANCNPNTDICDVDSGVLGNHVATGTGTSTFTTPVYPAGTNTFWANDITAGTNSVPSILTINKAQVIETLSNCGDQMLTSSGYSCTEIATFPTIFNQIIGNIIVNNNYVATSSSSSNSASYIVTNQINYFTFVANEVGNGNYLSNSISVNWVGYAPLYLLTTTSNPLITPSNAIFTIAHYPIQLYTVSSVNTIKFTLSNAFYTNSLTAIPGQTNVLNANFVPSSLLPSGNWLYDLTEFQFSNSIDITANFLPLNMIVLASQPSTQNSLIQYFPIAINPLSWISSPQSYFINTVSNSPNGYTIISSGTTTLNLNVKAVYPFTTFNLTQNTGLTTNSFSLNAFVYSTTSSGFTTRKLFNISTFDQQFFTPLIATTTYSFSAFFNGYNIPLNTITVTANNFQIFMPSGNFMNPTILVTNQSALSTAPSHFNMINNFLNALVSNTIYQNYKMYLANNNASLYAFQIYQGGSGYGCIGCTMVIQTGPSSSTAFQVESYLITAVPFALPLQNGQQYKFLFYDTSGNLIFTSPFSIWSNPIQIFLPSSTNAPPSFTPSINATCSAHKIPTNYILCTGIDKHNTVINWNITIRQINNLVSSPIVYNTVIPGTSFTLNWTVLNGSKNYVLHIGAKTGSQTNSSISVLSFQWIGTTPTKTVAGSDILAIILMVLGIALGYFNWRVAVILELIFLFFGTLATIIQILSPTFIIILIVSIVIIVATERRGR